MNGQYTQLTPSHYQSQLQALRMPFYSKQLMAEGAHDLVVYSFLVDVEIFLNFLFKSSFSKKMAEIQKKIFWFQYFTSIRRSFVVFRLMENVNAHWRLTLAEKEDLLSHPALFIR